VKSGKGFGSKPKADKLLEKELILSRIRNAPESLKRMAEANFDPKNLTENDFAYLALDFAFMVKVFLPYELPLWEGMGGNCHREEDGRFTGLSFFRHLETGEAVGVVLEQTSVGVPDWRFSEIFTTEAPGCSKVPEKDLDDAISAIEKTLYTPALAWSVAFVGKEKGFLSSYGMTDSHCEQKAEDMLPEGSHFTGPVCVSKHPSTVAANVFSFMLNKQAGRLHGNRPYSEIEELVGEKVKRGVKV
jgi:hypothetical protein